MILLPASHEVCTKSWRPVIHPPGPHRYWTLKPYTTQVSRTGGFVTTGNIFPSNPFTNPNNLVSSINRATMAVTSGAGKANNRTYGHNFGASGIPVQHTTLNWIDLVFNATVGGGNNDTVQFTIRPYIGNTSLLSGSAPGISYAPDYAGGNITKRLTAANFISGQFTIENLVNSGFGFNLIAQNLSSTGTATLNIALRSITVNYNSVQYI